MQSVKLQRKINIIIVLHRC